MHSELLNLYFFSLAIVKASLITGFAPVAILAVFAESKKGQLYIFRWAKCFGMPVLSGERKGQVCKVLARGKLNSCLIEFPDGVRAITSRNALRKAL
jgi:hypothetical protein